MVVGIGNLILNSLLYIYIDLHIHVLVCMRADIYICIFVFQLDF